jgi:hypothetical protein
MDKKILILQIETRTDKVLNLLLNENKNICKNNNIEYLFFKNCYNNAPPYWDKIFEIKKIMDTRNDIDYIYWLDSDAFLLNYNNNNFQKFLHENDKYSILITNDMPPWTAKFNAGAFIIKNNNIGKEVINKWISYYNPNKWKYDNNVKKWTTQSQWAGDDYEQGSFIKNILEDKNYSEHIKVFPYNILNNNSCIENTENTISVHLAGDHKQNEDTLSKCKNKLLYKDELNNDTLNNTNSIDSFRNFNEIDHSNINYFDNINYVLLFRILLIILIVILLITLSNVLSKKKIFTNKK